MMIGECRVATIKHFSPIKEKERKRKRERERGGRGRKEGRKSAPAQKSGPREARWRARIKDSFKPAVIVSP